MARPLRIEFAGALIHLTVCGRRSIKNLSVLFKWVDIIGVNYADLSRAVKQGEREVQMSNLRPDPYFCSYFC